MSARKSVPKIVVAAATAGSAAGDAQQSIWANRRCKKLCWACVPLPACLVLDVCAFIVLREGLANKLFTAYGLILSIVGMCVFNVGLTYGLGRLARKQARSTGCLYGNHH